MKTTTDALQLELIAGARRKVRPLKAGLLGRGFFAGASYVRVVGLCPANSSQVVLEREPDSKRWTAPSSLIRAIVGRGRRPRRAGRERAEARGRGDLSPPQSKIGGLQREGIAIYKPAANGLLRTN